MISNDEQKWFWRLCILSALSLVVFNVAGFLKPVMQLDSPSYLGFQWNWGSEGLSGVRTPGYPAFVQGIVHTLGLSWLPIAQAIIYLLSILFLFRSLNRMGFRAASAAAVCAPLVVGRTLSHFSPMVLADSLAISFSLLSLGFFVRLWKQPGRWWEWVGLSACVFAACITRPAFLYLVALWPVISLWFSWWGESHFSYAKMWRHFLGCATACMGPLLAYSLMRWFVIGHFGLVSFTGYNTIGISSQALLEPGVVDSLPAHLQPVGRKIAEACVERGVEIDTSSFKGLERNYDLMLWGIPIPIVAAECHDDPPAINKFLLQLTWHIFRERPDIYARWIVGNTRHAVLQHVIVNLEDIGTLCVVIAWGLLTLASLFRFRTQRSNRPHLPMRSEIPKSQERSLFPVASGFQEQQVLIWIVIFYLVSGSFLVILVEPATGRYMSPCSVLAPGLLGLITKLMFECQHFSGDQALKSRQKRADAVITLHDA